MLNLRRYALNLLISKKIRTKIGQVNGDKYEGEFLTIKDGGRQFQVYMHGKGKLYRYEEGKWFSGYWKDDDLDESVDDWDVEDI